MTMLVIVFTSPGRGAKYHYMSVCLSTRITREPHGQTSLNVFACCLWPLLGPPLTALQFCYVLPVLWMTSYSHTMEPASGQDQARRYVFRQAAVPVGRGRKRATGLLARQAVLLGRQRERNLFAKNMLAGPERATLTAHQLESTSCY